MRSPIETEWRNRLARNLRTFRRIKGRWPASGIVPAVKRSIALAAVAGIRPPYQH
jgi:hypothetical protein